MDKISLGSHLTDGRIGLNRPRHPHHSHHPKHSGYRAESANQADDSSPTTGNAAQGTVKQAWVNQITAMLKQSFNLRQSNVSIPGVSADEQASNDLAGAVGSRYTL